VVQREVVEGQEVLVAKYPYEYLMLSKKGN
jgi:hypothetical protein